MSLRIFSNYGMSAERLPIEVVERKGLGHPDTLADLIADSFSNKYSQHCLKNFNFIPHHWADKVTLVGAKSDIAFGKASILQPIKAFQFGRATQNVGGISVDVDSLFEEAVKDVFIRIFKDERILKYLDCNAYTHDGSGPDHPKEFYAPKTLQDIQENKTFLKANDTAFITASFGYSRTEILAIELENFLNSCDFKERYPATGYDIKVLAVREDQRVDVTVCIPFIAEKTSDHGFYCEQLREIHDLLLRRAKEICPSFLVSIHLNTKDFENHAYLTAFGTALDKGGCGAVGRGNRYNGVISSNREMAIEAPSGKNPTHHVGRLYNPIAFSISCDIYLNLGIENCVNIISRNGEDLKSPAFIFVKCFGEASGKYKEIEDLVAQNLLSMTQRTNEVINSDPIWEHVNRPRKAYLDKGSSNYKLL